jgi:hypothetical protein
VAPRQSTAFSAMRSCGDGRKAASLAANHFLNLLFPKTRYILGSNFPKINLLIIGDVTAKNEIRGLLSLRCVDQ